MKKIYCERSGDNPDCSECSLSNYGRDCRNNSLVCPDPEIIDLTHARFSLELTRALTFLSLADEPEDAAYWNGYQRGIRRAFHGNSFGTEDEHGQWCVLICEINPRRQSLGHGYRDGLKGKAKKLTEIFEMRNAKEATCQE